MRRRTLLLVALVLAVSTDLGLSACVGLPPSGPVRSVAVQDNAAGDTLFDYTPPGPRRGSAPAPLVDNFLTAMTATPLNTYVAREFLTGPSSSSWVPERGTVVYGSQQLVSRPGGRVVLRLRHVVALDSRGTWLGDPTHGKGYDYHLKLVKERGQWRISRPPNRLLVPRAHFDTEYQQFLLYFFDPSGKVLVPEPVYVPRGRQAPTLLVTGLLQGPEPALRRTERTDLPAGTSLDGISVPVSRSGTAEVPLSDKLLDADDSRLGRLFAQIAWTLGEVPGVHRVRITVGGTPVDLPGSGSDVGVDSFSQFDPALAWASSSLFGLRSGRLVSLDGHGENRVSGPSGGLALGFRSVAVDLLAQQVAGVTADGRRVLASDRDGVPGRRPVRADLRRVVSGATNLARPSYDLHGQLWVLDRRADGARLSVVRSSSTHQAQSVTAPGLTGRRISRFVLSRDGTRLVALLRRRGPDRLLIARVQRDDTGRVLRLGRAVPLTVPATAGRIRDMAWQSPAGLAVLTSATRGTSQVVLVSVDGSSAATDAIPDAELLDQRAVSLVTSADPAVPLYADTRSGQLYVLSRSGRWHRSAVRPGLVAPTFAG